MVTVAVLCGCAAAPDRLVTFDRGSDVSANAAAAPNASFSYPIVLESGSAEQLGAAHGEWLGADVHYLYHAYLSKFIQSRTQAVMAQMTAGLFRPFIRPEHLTEIDALARASSIDEQETLLGQCFLDITPLTGCSTVALPGSASTDGLARMGRNLDFWSLGVADRYTRVFIIRPTDGRFGFASIGWPGMVGVLTGMNEHGLTLANMEVPRSPRLPQAMPYPLLYRTVLERCRDVSEAVALLQRTPVQSANNLMLMDAAGNRAVMELSPGSVVVRWGLPGKALLSTNHQRGMDQDTPGKCRRYDRMHDTSTARFGQFDTRSVEEMMHTVGRPATLQSMVFVPSTLSLELAAGQNATTHPYSRLELRPFFKSDVVGAVSNVALMP